MMAAAMGSFGERLQREREMRGITLEEISESTKITSRCLQALEEEEFDKLPGGIFNKGFVRAYAHHLGIDEDQAVADFVVASGGEQEQPLPDPPEPRAVTLGQRAEGHPNWRAIALLVVLLVTAVAALWKLGPSAVHLVGAAWTARSNPEAAATSPSPPSVTPQSIPEVAATPPPPAATKKSVTKAKPV
ncbi:MAG: helix-turn-helix domain-containing protein, partial [Terriglobales bacterium]